MVVPSCRLGFAYDHARYRFYLNVRYCLLRSIHDMTYTLPMLTISFIPVTEFCLTAAIGVCILRLPSTTSTPTTIGPVLLNTATGVRTQGKTAMSFDSSFFFSAMSSMCL